ncbi:MAG TPA: type II toxin-antitoxin system VapC family toxin [Acidobacteriaceae bacterium]|nr:type II toxin-antitoxin system VapC family toxin [Acidobacteriaceae bacterium]
MFLLDTNIVSELRKARKANPGVRRWAVRVSAADLYLSVVSALEIEIGVLLAERRDPAQGAMLRSWFEDQLLPAFEGRLLPVDLPIVRRCALLHVPDRRSDRDALIAATALTHRMTVVTRNTQDFSLAGIRLLNPWQE